MIVAPASESAEPKPTMPADPVLRYRAVAEDADGLADREVLLLGGRLVDRDLPSPRGQSPVTSLNGLSVWSAEVSSADGDPVAGACRSACRPCRSRRASSSIDPCATRTPGRSPISVEHAGREGRRLGVAVRRLARHLRADDCVGGLVRLLVDAVEALAERVGEDEAAADHRDAEHDRERRQHRTELAPEQSFESDADHRLVTSSSVSRISGEVDGPRSLTIRPSARNRMRSAIAAACASWVTITVVWP